MEQPAKIDLHADRWVALTREIAFVGYDFTGATFAAQVRVAWDAPAALITLGTTTSSSAQGVKLMYAGSATLAAHIAAGRIPSVPLATNPATGLPYLSTDVVTLSNVRLRINETTMEALPIPNDENGPNLDLVWDLHITPDAGIKDKYAGGKFVVRGGATQ